MFESISAIFESNSDKARLIAILISSVVAVFILLLTQFFTSRRTKRELLIKKIEELYLASQEYATACRTLLDDLRKPDSFDINGFFNPDKEKEQQIVQATNKMEMLCSLYFPESNFKAEDFYIWHMPIIEMTIKNKEISEEESLMALGESRAHIFNSSKSLNDMCRYLMKKYGH